MPERASHQAEVEASRAMNDKKAEAVVRTKNAEKVLVEATRAARELSKKDSVIDYTEESRVNVKVSEISVDEVLQTIEKEKAVDYLRSVALIENRLHELEELEGIKVFVDHEVLSDTVDHTDKKYVNPGDIVPNASRNLRFEGKYNGGDLYLDGKGSEWVGSFNKEKFSSEESARLGMDIAALVKEYRQLKEVHARLEKEANFQNNVGKIIVERINQQTGRRFKL